MKKSSILIMVMFVLFISTFISILIIKYIFNILSYSSEFYKYYKAYYLAYWWVEISLVKILNHWFWFEDEINKTSNTSNKNIMYCPNNDCYFETKIYWLSKVINKNPKNFEQNQCDYANSDLYREWKWIIIPLFYDKNLWEWTLDNINYEKISKINWFSNIDVHIFDWNWMRYSIWVNDENNNSKNIKLLLWNSSTIQNSMNNVDFNNIYDDNFNSYLLIANSESTFSNIRFCVFSNNEKLPNSIFTIKSSWKFFDRVVSLEAIKNKPLPDYLIYNILK